MNFKTFICIRKLTTLSERDIRKLTILYESDKIKAIETIKEFLCDKEVLSNQVYKIDGIDERYNPIYTKSWLGEIDHTNDFLEYLDITTIISYKSFIKIDNEVQLRVRISNNIKLLTGLSYPDLEYFMCHLYQYFSKSYDFNREPFIKEWNNLESFIKNNSKDEYLTIIDGIKKQFYYSEDARFRYLFITFDLQYFLK